MLRCMESGRGLVENEGPQVGPIHLRTQLLDLYGALAARLDADRKSAATAALSVHDVGQVADGNAAISSEGSALSEAQALPKVEK